MDRTEAWAVGDLAPHSLLHSLLRRSVLRVSTKSPGPVLCQSMARFCRLEATCWGR